MSDRAMLNRIPPRPRRGRLHVAFGVLLVLALRSAGWMASETQPAGWSAELLSQILKEPAAAAAPAGGTRQSADSAEMVLQTYQLTHLRLGEAGKPQTALGVVAKLLPPGSSLNSDVPANSVHVLTTPAAHRAVWDYLSAIDVKEAPPVVASVPDDVKEVLKAAAQSRDESVKVLSAVDALKTGVSSELAAIETRQRDHVVRVAAGVGVVLLAVLALLFHLFRRRARTAAAAGNDRTELMVAPEQIASALVPVQDRMRNEMLGILNEVAIKLQAQHNEQQKLVREQQLQLESARLALAEERRQFITETGNMVVQAVERVDATTAKLAKQQDKVAELVEELQTTVRELDETKDTLRDREVQLEQERAKIAALSLLLEEGSPLPPAHETNDGDAPSPPRSTLSNSNAPATCNRTDPAPTELLPPPVNGAKHPPHPQRFTFLPPDHPQT